MPTEIEIDAVINTNRSEDGLAKLRKGLKELISLQSQVAKGSDQFKRLEKAINDTEGKIGDLTDKFQTLKGSGVERLSSSLGLLREGLLSADPDKLSIGMEGLGSAMKAIPIFLLIEGAKYLFENWEKLTAIFSQSAKEIRANEEHLKDLNEEVAINRVRTETLLIQKNLELKAIQRQGEAYEEVIKKIKEIDGLTQSGLRDELRATDKEVQNQIKKFKDLKNDFENMSETESLLQFFGINSGTTKEELKEAERALTQLLIKRGDAANKITAQTADTADRIAELEQEIRDRNEATRRKVAELRIQDIFKEEDRLLAARREQYKQEQYDNKNNNEVLKALSVAFNNDIIEIQKKFGAERAFIESENRNNEIKYQEDLAQYKSEQEKKLNQEIIDEYVYLKEALAQQDREANEDLANKRRIRGRNELAFDQAFEIQSLQQKVEFIEQDRDTQLLNEDLTQKQRIAIIEKAENDILQLKIKKGEEYISYAKAGAEILNGLNTLRTQNENYELNQQQYAKDAAIQNDANRTEEKLEQEQAYTNQQLSNDNLTSEQRAQITQNSENRQKKITADSKNAQLALANDFSKKEIAIRKKQFEAQKAIQIVTGVINTAAAVLQTIATIPYPANIPLAILAGAAGAIQVGIIASQKFDDGGASANASVNPVASMGSGSSGGGGFSSPAPQSPIPFNPGGQANAQTSTTVTDPVKVYVLESDIRNVTNKIDVIETRATF